MQSFTGFHWPLKGRERDWLTEGNLQIKLHGDGTINNIQDMDIAITRLNRIQGPFNENSSVEENSFIII